MVSLGWAPQCCGGADRFLVTVCDRLSRRQEWFERSDGSAGPPEHAVNKIAKTGNINTRRMVPHRICPIALRDRVSRTPVRSVTIQGGGEELSVVVGR